MAVLPDSARMACAVCGPTPGISSRRSIAESVAHSAAAEIAVYRAAHTVAAEDTRDLCTEQGRLNLGVG